MEYPVDRMNYIFARDPILAAKIWAASANAVQMLQHGTKQTCPYCGGHKFLGAFLGGSQTPYHAWRCIHCDENGQVTTPVWWLMDPHGGWYCCPICFEGQNPENEPCDICQWWLNELSVTLGAPPADEPEPVIRVGLKLELPVENTLWVELDLLYKLLYEGVFQLEVSRDRTLSLLEPLPDWDPDSGTPVPAYSPNPTLDKLLEDIRNGHALLDYLKEKSNDA